LETRILIVRLLIQIAVDVELNSLKFMSGIRDFLNSWDDKQHILNALKEWQERVDIVILTGGLGTNKR
jgi:nicotinamide-nucleotide amidase